MGSPRLTTEEWIERAKAVHGDLYDYSESVYVNQKVKVKIIDPEYGEFWMLPENHVRHKQNHPIRGKKNQRYWNKRSFEQIHQLLTERLGDGYDLSDLKYDNKSKKVTLRCKEHGVFSRHFGDILVSGKACAVCSAENRAPRIKDDEWWARIKAAHGDRYDYSETKLGLSQDKIKVICKVHGPFMQSLVNHAARGCECPKCAKEESADKRRYSQAQAIAEIEAATGGKYDLSLAVYKGANIPMKVICPEHGEFMSTFRHMVSRGTGCQACGRERCGDARRLTTEVFIQKARKVHGDKYDYSEVEYVSMLDHVKVICPKHGPWMQRPANHMSGHGCDKCRQDEAADRYRLSVDEFKAKIEKWGRVECLNPEDYTSYKCKLLFKCKTHGHIFETYAAGPLTGGGLECCIPSGKDNLESFLNDDQHASTDCFVYVAKVNGKYLKPGISDNLERRMMHSRGTYDEYVYTSPVLARCEAWAIEQAILRDSVDAYPGHGQMRDLAWRWGGVTEIRLKSVYDAQWYRDRAQHYLEEIQSNGWDSII